VRLAIVRFSERLDEVKALRVAMLFAAAVFAVYAWLPGTAGLMAGSAMLGIALGSVQPMILSMLHHVTPSDRHGQALGLRMLIVNGGTVSMPAGFGALAAATALAAPMWLMASALMLAQWPARKLRSP
jgi:MFS family permease